MNTAENNKIIAEFMVKNEGGLIKLSNTIYSTIDEYEIPDDHLTIKDLKYHSDWNLLMEVVEKIESIKLDKLSFGLVIEKDRVTIYYCHEIEPNKKVDLFFEWGQKTKIGNTYKIVCSFIEWYNEQNK